MKKILMYFFIFGFLISNNLQAAQKIKVCVLEFDGDKNSLNAKFAQMLPEIISANLQENDNIKIIERTALDLILQTQEFDKIFSNKEINKKLGIDFFLRGSFMNINDTLVITVSIIDARVGKLEYLLNSSGITLDKLLFDINIKISNYFKMLINKTISDSNTVVSPELNKDLELSEFFFIKGLGDYYSGDYTNAIYNLYKGINTGYNQARFTYYLAKVYKANNQHAHSEIELNKIRTKHKDTVYFKKIKSIDK